MAVAGVEIIETRLNHLAYAAEIASAMLQRQQARMILSARQTIVEGAVSMTQMALEQIEEGQQMTFSDDRKIQLINNLLVSIITDKGTQPVINTGDATRGTNSILNKNSLVLAKNFRSMMKMNAHNIMSKVVSLKSPKPLPFIISTKLKLPKSQKNVEAFYPNFM